MCVVASTRPCDRSNTINAYAPHMVTMAADLADKSDSSASTSVGASSRYPNLGDVVYFIHSDLGPTQSDKVSPPADLDPKDAMADDLSSYAPCSTAVAQKNGFPDPAGAGTGWSGCGASDSGRRRWTRPPTGVSTLSW